MIPTCCPSNGVPGACLRGGRPSFAPGGLAGGGCEFSRRCSISDSPRPHSNEIASVWGATGGKSLDGTKFPIREWTIATGHDFGMLKSYLTLAFRALRKHRLYSILNVAGLAVGLASFFLIALFIADEMSYDRYHKDADRVYRVAREWVDAAGDPTLRVARISAPIGPALEAEFADVEAAARIWGNGGLIGYAGEHFDEYGFYFASANVFDVLTIPLLEGNPATALQEPFTIILTAEKARKYFGDEDPMGKVLQLDTEYDLRVTGVVDDLPGNSHFEFDFLASMSTLEAILADDAFSSWRGNNSFGTYVRLAERADADRLEAEFTTYLNRQYTEEQGMTSWLFLQPLTGIHLHSNLATEFGPTGDAVHVYLFATVALLVLLIACFNFMNLATARTARRAREVGVRKVLGARRRQLAVQFLGEALLTSLLALVVGLLLAAVLLPFFNDVAAKDISLNTLQSGGAALALIGVAVVVGLLAGSYPAAYLSAFGPAEALRRNTGRRRSALYKALVVVQFGIAFVLAAGVGAVFKQLDFVADRPLGFDKEQIVVLPGSEDITRRFGSIRERLMAHPGVQSVTASRLIPSNTLLDQIDVRAEVGRDVELIRGISLLPVDHDFMKTYGVRFAVGRDFSTSMASDSTEAFLLNEAAVRQIGWTSPIEAVGRPITLEGTSLVRSGRVIGVVEDFHFESLHERISPIVFVIMPERHRLVSVKVSGDDLSGVLAFLSERWKDYRPGYPSTYTIIETEVEGMYASERRLGRVLVYFALLALFVACLGLFGLASYAAEERTKEIGIRKVMGATAEQIVALLSKDFARYVVLALVIAAPLVYLASARWLENFAYRTELGAGFFLMIAALILFTALATVSYQAVRAAVADPAKSLRYE